MDYDIVYNEDGTVSYVYEDGTVKTFQQTGGYTTGGGTTTGGTTPTPGTTGTGKKWWEQLLGTIPAVIGGIFGSNNNAGNYPNTPYTPTTQQAGNSNIMIIAVAAVVVIFLLMKKK